MRRRQIKYIDTNRHFYGHSCTSTTRFKYKMYCLRVTLTTFSLILLVIAQANMNGIEKRGGKRYCGETLNNMLMFICDGVYKRSDSEVGMMNWLPSRLTVNPFVYKERSYFPFKSRDGAVSLIPRQYKRGVADECCRKSCTLAELSTYCGVKSR